MAIYKALAIPTYYRRNWNASGCAGATNGSGGSDDAEAGFAGIEIYGKVNTYDTKLPNYIGADYVTYQYKVRKVTSGSKTKYQFKKN